MSSMPCLKLTALVWRSDTSWRDLYCEVCQSCFEIKSKTDKQLSIEISNMIVVVVDLIVDGAKKTFPIES
jgi:hypothetical protein